MPPASSDIYLDWNASTPVHPEVKEAMLAALEAHGANPSSAHAAGRRAREAVEEARAAVAALLGARAREIVFTGCGSESNNLAIAGTLALRPGGVVTSPIEHPSVSGCLDGLGASVAVATLPVTPDGVVAPEAADAVFPAGTSLLTVMRAHNETGVLQPVAELARRARGRGIRIHTDAVQAVGKVPVSVEELGVDLLSLSAHKFRGPKGVGALYVREGVELAPLVRGGGHERGLRGGTENVPGIVGLGKAAEVARRDLADYGRHTRELRDLLEAKVAAALPEAVVQGRRAERLPNTSFLSLPGVASGALLSYLDRHGVAISTGAACHEGDGHGGAMSRGVLAAMGVPPEVAGGTIRVSLGLATTREEIERAARLIVAGVGELGARAS